MRQTWLTAMAFVMMGTGPADVHEYVNPLYCYRVVLPAEITHMQTIRDNSGVRADIGEACSQAGCSHIEVFAINGDTTAPGLSSHLVQHYAQVGWRLRGQDMESHAMNPWHVTVMVRGSFAMVIYDQASDSAAIHYYLVAQFPDTQKAKFDQLLKATVASWKLVSECV